jgi:hypothetical protein
VLAWPRSPAIRQLFSGTSISDLANAPAPQSLTQVLSDSTNAVLTQPVGQQWQNTLLILLGALVIALPVALSYSLTRRRRGFTQSMVHILVLLPIAVAGMVALIQNSLALAFSLAGIVAVLRFRNALDDVKDGVYIFVGVAIGISAALGALTVGLLTSVVFNACVLILWWLDFARRPTPGIRGGVWRLMRLPKVHPPPAPNEGRAASEDGQSDKVFAPAARAWRQQLRLDPTSHKNHHHVNVSLRVQTAAPDESRPFVEDVLRDRAKRWRLVGVVQESGDLFTMKYRLRVHREDRDELLDAVRAASRIVGAEWR